MEAAKRCLRSVLEKIQIAIDELHKFGFAHLDIRLENVCFDKELNAVLIDLDR